jgi:hypothetical protein
LTRRAGEATYKRCECCGHCEAIASDAGAAEARKPVVKMMILTQPHVEVIPFRRGGGRFQSLVPLLRRNESVSLANRNEAT